MSSNHFMGKNVVFMGKKGEFVEKIFIYNITAILLCRFLIE